MEHFVALYENNPLFDGVDEAQLLPLLTCLQAKKKSYSKGALIFAEGERVSQLGIVLTGQIITVYEDAFGGRSIISTCTPGQLFSDAFSCSHEQRMPVSIIAQTDTDVLLIDVNLILHTCAHACAQHQRLSENLIHILADKYITINRKLIHLSGRTTRRKLLSYLSEQMRLAGGGSFAVSFNQQELADFLFIDRSGLSTEWNRLKREKILEPLPDGRYLLHITPCAGGDCDD